MDLRKLLLQRGMFSAAKIGGEVPMRALLKRLSQDEEVAGGMKRWECSKGGWDREREKL